MRIDDPGLPRHGLAAPPAARTVTWAYTTLMGRPRTNARSFDTDSSNSETFASGRGSSFREGAASRRALPLLVQLATAAGDSRRSCSCLLSLAAGLDYRLCWMPRTMRTSRTRPRPGPSRRRRNRTCGRKPAREDSGRPPTARPTPAVRRPLDDSDDPESVAHLRTMLMFARAAD